MTGTVFYSWQSDWPVNRSFIEKCLKAALTELNKASELVIEAAPDRALSGAAGAVRIDRDIERRIDSCEVFLADVSLITGTGAGDRPSPNPNVMIETGRASAVLGWERTILAFNGASGDTRDLPFDLDKHRLAIFKLQPGADSAAREAVAKNLTAMLREAIKAILGGAAVRPRLRAVLDQSTPEILQLVRSGQTIVKAMLSAKGVGDLEAAMQLRGATAVLGVTSTGGASPWAGQAVANHVMERSGVPGETYGYLLQFSDANW